MKDRGHLGDVDVCLVHDCVLPQNDDGMPFACDCVRQVPRKRAHEMVVCGHAFYKKQRNSSGRVAEIKCEIILRRSKQPPRAHTITDSDIQHAYVEHRRTAAERIRLYPGTH